MKDKLISIALILGIVVVVNAQGKGKDSGDKGGKSDRKENNHSDKGGHNNSKGNNKTAISIDFRQNGNKGNGINSKQKGNGNSGKDFNGKSNGNNKGNKNDFKQHGNGNAYGHYKGGKSGREFGQARAAAARSKHRQYQMVTIGDGRRFIEITLKRNILLLSLTSRKLGDLRIHLNDLRTAGTITTVVYEEKINRIEVLERRRAAIEVNINL
jgi:hypothetical protein